MVLVVLLRVHSLTTINGITNSSASISGTVLFEVEPISSSSINGEVVVCDDGVKF